MSLTMGISAGAGIMIGQLLGQNIDVYQHPRTVMDKNAEFLTKRPLKVKLICEL